MQRFLMIVLATFALMACDPAPSAPPKAPPETATPEAAAPAAIDIDDPTACQTCHANVYKEWTESMHSRAHHSKDPIYGSMRALRMKKQGEQIAGKCAKCHNSRSPLAPDTAAGMAGVSCASCHNVQDVHIKPKTVGSDALEWAEEGMIRSSRDLKPGASPVHKTGPALKAMQDGTTLCLACHNTTKTPAGQFACTTGPEFSEYAGKETCVSCHMPTLETPAGAFGNQKKHSSHQFLGPHRAWYQNDDSILAKAVDVQPEFKGDELVVTLVNRSAHSFPSGFPGRMVVLKVIGKDKEGAKVWENFVENPMKEHPESVLNKVYHDAEGKPAPAPFAEKLVRDNRLKPNESRPIVYAVPKSVVQAEVRVNYRLLPEKLAGVLGLKDEIEATPKVISSKSATR